MNISFNNPAGVAAPAGRYSHVARLDLGSGNGALLFISGQVALGPDGQFVGAGDVVAQAEQVFQNIATLLGAHGASMRDVVKLTTFLTDIADRARIADVRARHFPEGTPPPASTLVAVSALAMPEWLIEIEVVAVAR